MNITIAANISTFLLLGRWSRAGAGFYCCSLWMFLCRDDWDQKRLCHILDTHRALLLCVFCCECLAVPTGRKTCHLRSRRRAFPLCVFWYESPIMENDRNLCHTGCRSIPSPLYEFLYGSSGFLPWILLWTIRFVDRENDLAQREQAKSLSPVCVLWWILRVPATEKAWSHWGQGKGFSPEWILMWVLKCCDWEKDFVHLEQE